MGEAGGQFTERNQFFIVEVAGSEMSRAIDHDVNENGGQLRTFTNHLVQIGAKDSNNFCGLLDNNVSGRRNQSGVGH